MTCGLGKLKLFLENPYVSLAVGLAMVLSAASSIFDTLAEDIKHLHFRLHHGVILYALFNMVVATIGIYDKSRKLYEGTAKIKDAQAKLRTQQDGGGIHEDARPDSR